MTSTMREFKERMKQNLMNKENLINKYKDNPDLKACENFFSELTRILDGKYEVVGSCNQDISRYLIPAGTKEQITYYGKPELSFRISDHWSWDSNVKKCHDTREPQNPIRGSRWPFRVRTESITTFSVTSMTMKSGSSVGLKIIRRIFAAHGD